MCLGNSLYHFLIFKWFPQSQQGVKVCVWLFLLQNKLTNIYNKDVLTRLSFIPVWVLKSNILRIQTFQARENKQ